MERKEGRGRPGAPNSQQEGTPSQEQLKSKGEGRNSESLTISFPVIEWGTGQKLRRLSAFYDLNERIEASLDKELGEELSKEGAGREKLILDLFDKKIVKDNRALERLKRLQSRKK
jgi:hypothetical protein